MVSITQKGKEPPHATGMEGKSTHPKEEIATGDWLTGTRTVVAAKNGHTRSILCGGRWWCWQSKGCFHYNNIYKYIYRMYKVQTNMLFHVE